MSGRMLAPLRRRRDTPQHRTVARGSGTAGRAHDAVAVVDAAVPASTVDLDEWARAREVSSDGEPVWSWPVLGSSVALLVALAALIAWLYTLPFGAK